MPKEAMGGEPKGAQGIGTWPMVPSAIDLRMEHVIDGNDRVMLGFLDIHDKNSQLLPLNLRTSYLGLPP